MEQYISKSALIKEIKRYKHKADERLKIKGRTLVEDRKDSALQNLCGNLLYFIDTLEVKEVDFVKEFYTFSEKHKLMDKGIEFADIEKTASFFFQLGLKAAQKGE